MPRSDDSQRLRWGLFLPLLVVLIVCGYPDCTVANRPSACTYKLIC